MRKRELPSSRNEPEHILWPRLFGHTVLEFQSHAIVHRVRRRLCYRLVLGAPAPQAATCTAKDFAAAVDQSGASLRALTLEAQPKLQERMRRYKAAKNLSDTEYENSALDAIQDSKLDAFDQKSSDLLLTVNSLGRVPDGAEPDCAKLDQVKSAAAELNTVIKAKSDYMLQRLDEKIAEAEQKRSRLQSPRPLPPRQRKIRRAPREKRQTVRPSARASRHVKASWSRPSSRELGRQARSQMMPTLRPTSR